MASFRAPLCISCRDDLRRLAARLLDLVPFGATSDRRGVLCSRPVDRSRTTPAPSPNVPQRQVFDRRSTPLARHLPGDQPPAFVTEPAPSLVGWPSDHHGI